MMKLYSVQYLRAVAALMVVLAHALEYAVNHDNFDYIRTGRFGVIMFFVISGFIMVFITGQSTFDPIKFLKRRIARIVPLYWLATTAVAALAILLPSLLKNTTFSYQHYFLSLLFVPHTDAHGDTSPMLSLGWTLNYEMFFYLAFACLAFVGGLKRLLILTALFLALTIWGIVAPSKNMIVETFTQYLLLSFVVGGWIGWIRLNDIRLRGMVGTSILTVLCIATLIASYYLELGTRGYLSTGIAMTFASAALLQIALDHEEAIAGFEFARWLGDASYSIYLVHMYAVGVVVAVYHYLHLSPTYLPLVVISAFLIGTIAGLLTYELVEKPIIRLFQPKRKPRPAVPAASVPEMS